MSIRRVTDPEQLASGKRDKRMTDIMLQPSSTKMRAVYVKGPDDSEGEGERRGEGGMSVPGAGRNLSTQQTRCGDNHAETGKKFSCGTLARGCGWRSHCHINILPLAVGPG